VLDNYSGDIWRVLSCALDKAPQEAIAKILERAEDGSLSDRKRDELVNLLASWAKDIRIQPRQAIERRRCLARTAKKYLLAGGDRGLSVRALLVAISPEQAGSSVDPGTGDKYTLTWRLLPPTELRQVPEIWDEGRDAIAVVDAETWQRLSRSLWGWIYPKYAARSSEVDPERTEAMHAFAAKALLDLAPLAAGSPGLAAGLRDLGERLGIELPLASDPTFELLFAPMEAAIRSAQAVIQASMPLRAIGPRGLPKAWPNSSKFLKAKRRRSVAAGNRI
jgi:hypothetical protein